MLQAINPKLPMRDKALTIDFYASKLGFSIIANYDEYVIITKDCIEIHFFEFKNLDPLENYGQVYIRVQDIERLYKELVVNNIVIHTNGKLELKPWGQMEFALLDPDNNLLTFGQAM